MTVASDYQDLIFEGMARTLWLLAYADWVEEVDQDDGEDESDDDDEVERPAGPGPGGDWDDVTPPTPIAALHAAHDLGELIATANHLASGHPTHKPLTQLFYQAMTVHLGVTFPLDDEPWVSQIKADPNDRELRMVYADWLEVQGRNADAAYVRTQGQSGKRIADGFAVYRDEAERFGSCLAFEAEGHGVGWGDDHVTARGTVRFQPERVDFECHYNGQDLEWAGRVRKGDWESRPLTQGHAPARYQEDESIETGRVARGALSTAGEREIIYVNENDQNVWRHNFILWFGAYRDTLLRVWANALDDALDEAIDWIRDNEPDMLSTDFVNEEFARLKLEREAEIGRELSWEDDADNQELTDLMEEAEQDTTQGGNYGDYIGEWGIAAEDPSDTDVLRIAGLTKNPPPRHELASGVSDLAFGIADLIPNAPRKKKEPESFVDTLATFMFKNTVTARMLRELAERGSMPQADFMKHYTTRCERSGNTAKSAFVDNFGRFIVGSAWGWRTKALGWQTFDRQATMTPSGVPRVIEQEQIPGKQYRVMLHWRGPSLDELVSQMSPAKRQWAYENLENQLLKPRATDNAEETGRWIERLRGPRMNPSLGPSRTVYFGPGTYGMGKRGLTSVDHRRETVLHKPGSFGKARR